MGRHVEGIIELSEMAEYCQLEKLQLNMVYFGKERAVHTGILR